MTRNDRLFYVEAKNASGEYEPLGIMTMEKAIEWAWNHDHATLRFSNAMDRLVNGQAGSQEGIETFIHNHKGVTYDTEQDKTT